MSAKKSSAKKTAAAPVAPPAWDGPFYSQHSCLIRNTYEIPVSEIPVQPEYISACLSNLAASEHLADDNTIVPGPAEWCVQFLGRVLREAPEAMQDALAMQCGTDTQQGNRQAMYVARGVVAIAAIVTREQNVPMITVSDLRDIMKEYHSSLYQFIPSEHRALAVWLGKAKLKHLGQRRGKAKSAGMKAFEAWTKAQLYFPEQK